jgi:hypothetical protein
LSNFSAISWQGTVTFDDMIMMFLCVVKGVITTSDKTEIKRTDNTDVNIKLSEKVSLFFITTNTLP